MMKEAAKKKKQAHKGLFLVWSPEGPTAPTVTHVTHKSALFEAHRMAKQFRGQRFFVMRTASKAAVVAPDATT